MRYVDLREQNHQTAALLSIEQFFSEVIDKPDGGLSVSQFREYAGIMKSVAASTSTRGASGGTSSLLLNVDPVTKVLRYLAYDLSRGLQLTLGPGRSRGLDLGR